MNTTKWIFKHQKWQTQNITERLPQINMKAKKYKQIYFK